MLHSLRRPASATSMCMHTAHNVVCVPLPVAAPPCTQRNVPFAFETDQGPRLNGKFKPFFEREFPNKMSRVILVGGRMGRGRESLLLGGAPRSWDPVMVSLIGINALRHGIVRCGRGIHWYDAAEEIEAGSVFREWHCPSVPHHIAFEALMCQLHDIVPHLRSCLRHDINVNA
jgi:hypothetical protein